VIERKIIQFREGSLKRKFGSPIADQLEVQLLKNTIRTNIPIILKTGFCGLGGVGGFVVDALAVLGVGLEVAFSDMAADTAKYTQID
jgi:hypothetical protein